MSTPERWTLQELCARYYLEPELQDFFVEGHLDVEILSHASSVETRLSSPVFYAIEAVDVPSELLQKHRLTEGCKQRVIALAKELDDAVPSSYVKCIVDSDLDHWTGNMIECPKLNAFSGTSIESFFFNNRIVSKILITTAKSRISNFPSFFSSVGTTLTSAFALRLADHELQLQLQWIDISRYLETSTSSIKLDRPRYIDAVLNKNSKMRCRASFLDSITRWDAAIHGETTKAIRGHDFTEILAAIVKGQSGVKSYATREAIERLLVLMAPEVAPQIFDELLAA